MTCQIDLQGKDLQNVSFIWFKVPLTTLTFLIVFRGRYFIFDTRAWSHLCAQKARNQNYINPTLTYSLPKIIGRKCHVSDASQTMPKAVYELERKRHRHNKLWTKPKLIIIQVRGFYFRWNILVKDYQRMCTCATWSVYGGLLMLSCVLFGVE